MSGIPFSGNGERTCWLRSWWPGWLGFMALVIAMIAALITISNTHGDSEKFLMREGAALKDAFGYFQILNPGKPDARFVFHTKVARSPLIVLENEALEEIYKLTDWTKNPVRRWTVSGTYTEFRRENYLLITKAEGHNFVSAPPDQRWDGQ